MCTGRLFMMLWILTCDIQSTKCIRSMLHTWGNLTCKEPRKSFGTSAMSHLVWAHSAWIKNLRQGTSFGEFVDYFFLSLQHSNFTGSIRLNILKPFWNGRGIENVKKPSDPTFIIYNTLKRNIWSTFTIKHLEKVCICISHN